MIQLCRHVSVSNISNFDEEQLNKLLKKDPLLKQFIDHSWNVETS